MSTKKDLTELLIKELYSDFTLCGPEHAYEAFHRRANRGVSKHLDGVIVDISADKTYHPEIFVVVDFTHKFTIDTDTTDKVTSKRPLSAKVFEKKAIALQNYFKYYFNYVLSYGEKFKDDPLSPANTFLQAAAVSTIGETAQNEYDNLFYVNTVLNYFLTNISVERSRGTIGSATVTLRDNANYKNGKKVNIFSDNTKDILNQLFVPMLPIMIWARGRLYKDWYFPIFDGYIMSSNTGNANGFTTITLSCKDTLELARITHEMMNPAIIQVKELKKQTAVNIYSQALYGIDHMQIFKSMFHGGTIIIDPKKPNGQRWLLPDSPEYKKLKRSKLGDVNTPEGYQTFDAIGNFFSASDKKDPNEVFAIEEDKAIYRDNLSMDTLLQKLSHVSRPRYTVSWGGEFTPYRNYEFQSVSPYTSEFSDRLSVIQDVAGMVYWDLYVDAYGNVQYHPMRFSNEFLKFDVIAQKDNKRTTHEYTFPGVHVISKEETTNMNTQLNIEELVTFVRLSGVFPEMPAVTAELLGLVGSYVDANYMGRFGYRRREVTNPMFNLNHTDPESSKDDRTTFMDNAAKALTRYMNGELYTRTATIIFRPEMDIAFPVLFTDDNNVFFIQSISHNVTIGGDATTTINSNFGRKDIAPPLELTSIILETEAQYKNRGRPTDPADVVTRAITNVIAPVKGVYNKITDYLQDKLDAIAEAEEKKAVKEANRNRKNKDKYAPNAERSAQKNSAALKKDKNKLNNNES